MANDFGVEKVVSNLRKNFYKGVLRSAEARRQQLQQLSKLVVENEDEIYDAVYKDLHKCKVEADVMEVMQLKLEIGHALENLRDWMKPEYAKPDLINMLNRAEIKSEPYGVTLIIGAWNYPIHLTLTPLVGALAAGNCVVLKPSELSPNTADILEKLVNKYMNPDCVRIINGGIPETQALLAQRLDHIFFTGGTNVGKIVMRAASENLTPVVLELGGKCPVIVDETCDFDVVAQRIAWGKYCNAGQTCLAPDYVLCVGKIQDRIVASVRKAIENFYGKDQKISDSYGRIINKRHYERLCGLIVPSKVAYGNVRDDEQLYISPTIMTNVTGDDAIMGEETFGPILSLVSVNSIDEAIEFVNSREKPLALYAFSMSNEVLHQIRDRTSSGGFCANDALVQAAIPSLPFGGVGHSGTGSYHGKHSFDCFSHRKACLFKNQSLEMINKVRYPPYDANWKPLIYLQKLLIPSGKERNRWLNSWFLAFVGAVFAIAYYILQNK